MALDQLDKQLHSAALLETGTVHFTKEGIDAYSRQVNQWKDVTYEILRRLFNNEEYADSFESASHGAGFLTTYDPPRRHFERSLQGFRNAVARLQSIREVVASVLPNAPGPEPGAHESVAPTFRDLHIHVSNANIGQFNVADTVKNIETNITTLGAQSATEGVALALKELTEAVVNDTSLPDEARQDLIEHFETLSEAANASSERRRGGMIRAVLASVPALLGTAVQAREAWDAWGPTLTHFFGTLPLQP